MSRPAARTERVPGDASPLAELGPGGFILSAACRPDVRRGLEANPRLVGVARASSSGGAKAYDLCIGSAYNLATQLHQGEGIDIRHLLPADQQVLLDHHRTTATVEQFTEANGTPFTVRWSLWSPPGSGLVLLLINGSGTKIDAEDVVQPVLKRVAVVTRDVRPSVVFARSLTRIGRGHPGALIDVLQYLSEGMPAGPFLGDDRTPLTEINLGAEVNLAIQGVFGKHDAKNLVQSNRVGMRARTGTKYEPLPGVWEFGTNRVPPPGLTTLTLRTPDRPTAWNALVLDCPAARPDEHYIIGGLQPPLIPGTDEVADQVALIRWLGENLFDGTWDAQACAVELARMGYAPSSLRQNRSVTVVDGEIREENAVRLLDGYAGRNNGNHALRAFLNNLDFYETGELTVNLPDGPPVTLTGVLPLDGEPWITAPQAARIREADRKRHTGPARKFLFSALKVIVDDQPAVLGGRWRTKDELVHPFERPGEHCRTVDSPRAQAIPPLPHETLARWYAEALVPLAHPLSLQLAARPADADPWQVKAARLDAEVRMLERAQADRDLDKALRTSHPRSFARLLDIYEKAEAELETKRDERDEAQHQARLHAQQPVLAGAPLAGLAGLAAALLQPYDDTGHRDMLTKLTESLVVRTVRRISTGKKPAYDLEATLTLQMHDGSDSWRAVSRHTWTGGCAIERTPARIAAAVDGLYAGRPLRESLHADWFIWLPALRVALGCPGPFGFANADDPRLLRLIMAVIYPRRTVTAVPSDPEHIPCYADPPLDLDNLPALADRLHEPVALLRAIHTTYSQPRPWTWLYARAPGLAACYAAAARAGGIVPLREFPRALRGAGVGPRASVLASEWTADDGRAALQPCPCGSVRRIVLRLREVSGSLCLDCRHDRAGVHWPPAYDRYLDPVP